MKTSIRALRVGQLLLVPNIASDWMPAYLNAFVEAAVLAEMVGIGLETCFPKLGGAEVHFKTDANGNRVRIPADTSLAIDVIVKARNSVRPEQP